MPSYSCPVLCTSGQEVGMGTGCHQGRTGMLRAASLFFTCRYGAPSYSFWTGIKGNGFRRTSLTTKCSQKIYVELLFYKILSWIGSFRWTYQNSAIFTMWVQEENPSQINCTFFYINLLRNSETLNFFLLSAIKRVEWFIRKYNMPRTHDEKAMIYSDAIALLSYVINMLHFLRNDSACVTPKWEEKKDYFWRQYRKGQTGRKRVWIFSRVARLLVSSAYATSSFERKSFLHQCPRYLKIIK